MARGSPLGIGVRRASRMGARARRWSLPWEGPAAGPGGRWRVVSPERAPNRFTRCLSRSFCLVFGSMTSAGKRSLWGTRLLPDRNQAYRAISTGQLNASPRLHLQPIDVVVFHGPQGRPGFEGGFPLRCLQRLSCPFVATQHCRWHDNWSTSGTFTPVLSY